MNKLHINGNYKCLTHRMGFKDINALTEHVRTCKHAFACINQHGLVSNGDGPCWECCIRLINRHISTPSLKSITPMGQVIT